MAGSRISLDQVRHVARLARLGLDDDELHELRGQLELILQYFASLEQLEVEGVEPTFHPHGSGSPLRADAVRDGLKRGEVLAAAPRHVAGGFAVPRVIEEDT